MYEDKFRSLRIILVIALIIVVLGVLAYALYGFSLFWATFAAGITIGILLIIILAIIILSIYLWIRTLILKREAKRHENELEQAKMELNNCRSKLNKLETKNDDD